MPRALPWMSVGLALLENTSHTPGQSPRTQDVGVQGLSLDGKPAASDGKLRVKVTPERHADTPAHIYLVKLSGLRNYRIAVESAEFDAVLVVQGEDGQRLALDDDSGGGLNAALTLPVVREGTYRLCVTTGKKYGRCKLDVKDAGPLEVRTSFGAAHPFFWGAFALTGRE